jgi:hypothetical protein
MLHVFGLSFLLPVIAKSDWVLALVRLVPSVASCRIRIARDVSLNLGSLLRFLVWVAASGCEAELAAVLHSAAASRATAG